MDELVDSGGVVRPSPSNVEIERINAQIDEALGVIQSGAQGRLVISQMPCVEDAAQKRGPPSIALIGGL